MDIIGQRASDVPATVPPRCGDYVLHAPTGETWVVAWTEGNDIAWGGWPDGIGRLSDCTVTKRCTDTEHAAAVAEWRALRGYDSRRNRVLRLYGSHLAGSDWLKQESP